MDAETFGDLLIVLFSSTATLLAVAAVYEIRTGKPVSLKRRAWSRWALHPDMVRIAGWVNLLLSFYWLALGVVIARAFVAWTQHQVPLPPAIGWLASSSWLLLFVPPVAMSWARRRAQHRPGVQFSGDHHWWWDGRNWYRNDRSWLA